VGRDDVWWDTHQQVVPINRRPTKRRCHQMLQTIIWYSFTCYLCRRTFDVNSRSKLGSIELLLLHKSFLLRVAGQKSCRWSGRNDHQRIFTEWRKKWNFSVGNSKYWHVVRSEFICSCNVISSAEVSKSFITYIKGVFPPEISTRLLHNHF